MAFPQTVLPIKQEMLINGVWTDITGRTRLSGNVNITRGYSSEQSRASTPVGSAGFTLNNRDYFFSNRSPSSANYGVIGRNTQYRVSLTESTPWLWLADYSDATGTYDGARATTADKAVLDITGDIDVRIDVRPDNWRGGRGMVLASKYNSTGNNRSWVFWVDRSGYLWFRWSTDGTLANSFDVQSTAVVSALRRQALRVTVDADNGAGSWVVTFYTSDTISGTWTQLGSSITSTGSITIFSGTADLQVGTLALGSGCATRAQLTLPATPAALVDPFVGRIYRFQLYNGIAGTKVADMDATAQTAGTTSWSDGLTTPNTWTLSASASITKQSYRFWGEVPAFPQQWDVSGTDIFGDATAYDLINRKTQGSKSLRSAIYRNLIRYTDATKGTSGTMDGYWPMENGTQATTPSPTVGQWGQMSNMVFSTDTDMPGTAGVLTWSSDSGTVSGGGRLGAATGVVTLLFYFRAPSIPAGTVPLISFYLIGGTTANVTISVTATTYNLVIKDSSDNVQVNSAIAFGTGGEPNQPMAMRVMLTQNGANVDYAIAWYPVGGAVLFGASSSYGPATVGRCGGGKTWQAGPATGKAGWWIAHVATFREDIGFTGGAFTSSTNAYAAERCEDRFARLCVEEGVPYWIVGRAHDSSGDPNVGEQMGPQTQQTFMTLLAECVALDRGLMFAPRDKFGITFRLHNSLINRECVELDYGANQLSPGFVPRDDLFFARNDVTVSNATGGSARYTKTTGALNTNEPDVDPDGIGTYDPGPVTRNAYSDDRLPALAQEEVFHGTWDEIRYPSIPIERARSVFTGNTLLDADVLDLDVGDALRVVNLPAQTSPDDAETLVIGYAESLQNRGHPIAWNTEPYGPYRSLNDLTASALAHARLAATSSTLAASINSSVTSFTVATTSGPLWRTGSSSPTFPIAIMVGGEEMSVGSISGTSSPQTFSSVTRSSNGQVLSHASGQSVQVRDLFYVGRDLS